MRAARWRVALVGALLLTAVALVVYRAEQSIAYERVARHDAVAERLFDEIEGELSALLDAEERRGLADTGKGATAWPFTLGRFELGADGALRATAESAALGTPRRALLERLTRAALTAPDENAERGAASRAALAQRAGSTRNLKSGGKATPVFEADDEAYSAYDALQSLNRSVERRALRKDRGVVADAREASREGRLESGPRLERELSAQGRLGRSGTYDGDVKETVETEEAVVFRRRNTAPPLQARVLDPGHLLLYRATAATGRAVHEGVWVDIETLYGWLEANALGGAGLGTVATLRFAGPFDDATPLPAGEFVYRHRFGEPFDELRATLTLDPLPGLGGAATTRALSALLFAAALLSLIALYRMVVVAVRFAERRSNFAAAVSHELKTPLTAIRMYAEMLRDDLVSNETQRRGYYTSITDESERLSRLVDNVLEFSKLEQGRHELSLQVGALEPVVRDVERLLATHLEREGFTLRVEIDPGLPPVRYDRDALIQVLFNLVDNAAKYAGDTAPKEVTLRCEAHDGGVAVSVRDFGPGLAAGELRRVFEPFYRSGPELTRQARGTGIGLSLVRSLGEAMGASVRAENAEPRGLRVSLALPAARPA